MGVKKLFLGSHLTIKLPLYSFLGLTRPVQYTAVKCTVHLQVMEDLWSGEHGRELGLGPATDHCWLVILLSTNHCWLLNLLFTDHCWLPILILLVTAGSSTYSSLIAGGSSSYSSLITDGSSSYASLVTSGSPSYSYWSLLASHLTLHWSLLAPHLTVHWSFWLLTFLITGFLFYSSLITKWLLVFTCHWSPLANNFPPHRSHIANVLWPHWSLLAENFALQLYLMFFLMFFFTPHWSKLNSYKTPLINKGPLISSLLIMMAANSKPYWSLHWSMPNILLTDHYCLDMLPFIYHWYL